MPSQYATNTPANAATLVTTLQAAIAVFSSKFPTAVNTSVVALDASISGTLGYNTSQWPNGNVASLVDFNSEAAMISFYKWYTGSSYYSTIKSLYTKAGCVQTLERYLKFAPGQVRDALRLCMILTTKMIDLKSL